MAARRPRWRDLRRARLEEAAAQVEQRQALGHPEDGEGEGPAHLARQRAQHRRLYLARDLGPGTSVRFMDDLERMFVAEDCGGDLNFTIYTLGNDAAAFASLNPPEVRRLLGVLLQRVGACERGCYAVEAGCPVHDVDDDLGSPGSVGARQ